MSLARSRTHSLNRPFDRSLDRPIARSLDRSVARSIARSMRQVATESGAGLRSSKQRSHQFGNHSHRNSATVDINMARASIRNSNPFIIPQHVYSSKFELTKWIASKDRHQTKQAERSSDRGSDRATERTTERAIERSSDRPSDQQSDQTTERSIDRITP